MLWTTNAGVGAAGADGVFLGVAAASMAALAAAPVAAAEGERWLRGVRAGVDAKERGVVPGVALVGVEAPERGVVPGSGESPLQNLSSINMAAAAGENDKP